MKYGLCERYGKRFNLLRWIKSKFHKRKGWGTMAYKLDGLDESEEEL